MKWKRVNFPILENKLFFRILFYFLSLLLPILIIGSIFYFNSMEKLQKDFSDKIELNLHASADTIDIYLQTVQETSMSFFYDDSVQTFLLPYGQYTLGEKANLRKISNVLTRIRNMTMEYVDHIFVYIDDQMVYTDNGTENYQLFFEKFYKFDKYESGYWTTARNTGHLLEILAPSRVTTGQNARTVIPFVIRNVVKGNNAVIVTAISAKKVMETIKNNSIFSSTEYIILDHEKRFVMSSHSEGPRYLDEINQVVAEGEIKNAKIRISGRDYMVIPQKSEIYGWMYYSITPVEEFGNHARGLITVFLLICIVLIIIGIIFSFIFTVNLYNPIKKIRDILLAQDGSPDYHTQNELDFIGMGVHQLIENNQKLNMVTKEYVDNALDNLIQGNQLQNENEVQKILFEKFGFHNSTFMCCTIHFDFKDRFYSDLQEVDRIVILNKLKKVIWGLLAEHVKTYVLDYSHHLYICVVNMNPHDDRKLKQALDGLSQAFQYDSQYCVITIGLGKLYEGLAGITKSYGDAMTAIENRQNGPSFQIVDSAGLPIQNKYFYSFTDENKIINLLKLGDWDQLISTIEAVIRENKQQGVSRRFMSLLLSEIFQTGHKFALERGFDISLVLSEEEFYKLSVHTDSPLDTNEKLQLLLRFYRESVSFLSKQSIEGAGQESRQFITEVMTYIEEHYHEDLFLEKLSGIFGLSPKYLSRSFKEKTGTNLTDFISQVRIEKAKSLLREHSELNISTIAEMVGIYSRMTFLRLFRKFEGVSPNEFREICRKGKIS